MDGTSGVYWSIKPNILKGHVWFLPKPNEFLQILYWKSGEFPLEIGGICTGNRDRIHWKFGAWFAFCKKKPPPWLVRHRGRCHGLGGGWGRGLVQGSLPHVQLAMTCSPFIFPMTLAVASPLLRLPFGLFPEPSVPSSGPFLRP